MFFKKAISKPFSELAVYSLLNPIPFTLKFSCINILPETIYKRYLSGENFIEFRFNKNTKQLYEVTLIAVQNNTIIFGDNNIVCSDDYFDCYIDENSELEILKPIKIFRTSKSLIFSWGSGVTKSYRIAKNCILSVDDNNDLCSLNLININEEIIIQILGF